MGVTEANTSSKAPQGYLLEQGQGSIWCQLHDIPRDSL